MVLLNCHSDLASPLAKLQSGVSRVGNGSTASAPPYFSLWLFSRIFLPSGTPKASCRLKEGQVSYRKPKMVQKLVVQLTFTLFSIETVSRGKFSTCLVLGKLKRGYSRYTSPILLLPAVCLEFFHISVALGTVSSSYLSYEILLVIILALYICFCLSVLRNKVSLLLCHHFGTRSNCLFIFLTVFLNNTFLIFMKSNLSIFTTENSCLLCPT